MVANITITGRVGTSPQCFTTENGNAFTRFRMAQTPRMRRGDEWVDGETLWFTVRTYGQLARNAAILEPGNPVLAAGQWRVETWTDANGEIRVDNVLVADSLGPDFQFCRAHILPRVREARVPDRERMVDADNPTEDGNGEEVPVPVASEETEAEAALT